METEERARNEINLFSLSIGGWVAVYNTKVLCEHSREKEFMITMRFLFHMQKLGKFYDRLNLISSEIFTVEI